LRRAQHRCGRLLRARATLCFFVLR
jgi:hypothetical protein